MADEPLSIASSVCTADFLVTFSLNTFSFEGHFPRPPPILEVYRRVMYKASFSDIILYGIPDSSYTIEFDVLLSKAWETTGAVNVKTKARDKKLQQIFSFYSYIIPFQT